MRSSVGGQTGLHFRRINSTHPTQSARQLSIMTHEGRPSQPSKKSQHKKPGNRTLWVVRKGKASHPHSQQLPNNTMPSSLLTDMDHQSQPLSPSGSCGDSSDGSSRSRPSNALKKCGHRRRRSGMATAASSALLVGK